MRVMPEACCICALSSIVTNSNCLAHSLLARCHMIPCHHSLVTYILFCCQKPCIGVTCVTANFELHCPLSHAFTPNHVPLPLLPPQPTSHLISQLYHASRRAKDHHHRASIIALLPSLSCLVLFPLFHTCKQSLH